jgi:hypothetical protein
MSVQTAAPPFSGSYDPGDIQFLLKPVRLAFTDIGTKERLIQSGRRHYSEMLSAERPPDAAYLIQYRRALARHGERFGADIGRLAARLDVDTAGAAEVVLVSLVRAGAPVGVLLGRSLRRRGRRVAHYGVSVIRDRGVDRQALRYIADRHDVGSAVFVDGWTGKGAIARELRRDLAERPFGFEPRLAVVADPAGAADMAAGGEDYLIPSGLLNGVISGLVSRSVLNAEVVEPGDFHGCVRLDDLRGHDLSGSFIAAVDPLIPGDAAPAVWTASDREARRAGCDALLAALRETTGVADDNLIKPGLAESTRALLRRSAGALFVDQEAPLETRHLRRLARELGLPVHDLPPGSGFRAAAVIARVGAE